MASRLMTPRLSEINLARIAPMDVVAREKALRSLMTGRGFSRYNGVFQSLAEVFNIEMNPYLPVLRSPWPQVENFIRHNSAQTKPIIESNINVGKALFEWGVRYGVTGVRHQFEPMMLSPSAGTVAYWHDIIIRLDGKSFVPFVDPRKDDCLTPEGRRFVFSIQHTHINEHPDFKDIGFVIFQFTDTKVGSRQAVAHFSDGCEYRDFKVLQTMVDDTYRQFRTMIAARAKGLATGTDG
jgi:hypothetical protein